MNVDPTELFNILVKFGGAHEGIREDFMATLSGRHMISGFEYRFQGVFGFGGKLYFQGGEYYVQYYKEDKSRQRESSLKKINIELAKLTKEKKDATTR